MPSPSVQRIEDSTPFHAAVDWKMGALAIAAAIAAVWFFKLPLVFDPSAPEFNPAIFVPVLLLAYGLWQLVRAMGSRAAGRRFGATVLELAGDRLRPGGTLRGRVVTSRDLAASQGFRLRLRCIASRRIERSSSGQSRAQDEILWEAEQTAKTERSHGEGIPVEFAIPKGAASKAAGDPLRWILEVEAKVEGARFAALFGIPVADAAD